MIMSIFNFSHDMDLLDSSYSSLDLNKNNLIIYYLISNPSLAS
jgi:hypothetical protein